MKPIAVICGPTASGKTGFAVDLAEKLNTEVVSADSMLVYKRLNIGTAKPTPEEMRNVRHHMIDVVSPTEKFSVSDYRNMALPVIERLLNEGKTPVICGGTGFYIEALLYRSEMGGFGANEEVRAKYAAVLREMGAEEGAKYLHSLLEKADSESAARLHVNDVKRVIRALEIYECTGRKKSEQHDTKTPRFRFYAYCVSFPRETLYQRIDKRVDEMFERGLVNEVEELLHSGVRRTDQCMQGIGYKEVIEGILDGVPWERVKDNVKRNTRRYAKRQITFFKRMQNLIEIPFKALETNEKFKYTEDLF
ncbi:MAG: tRNA (adenosine(37)-N6)-dimethylallyltransferase MiaA [Candidatus Borkfalkiaceae bacterium]|nr:tRNA (adenosine(37)-N6)-dimethylallyltransferase MiaA [Clostridia bacterium]MDY6222619.1 tRNA (adenosine(37)-N6)-dimethylallyltransferase MiaA [Christensenellaceae bacterium]